MKRWSILIASAVVALGLIAAAVPDIPDSVKHFSSRPGDLLLVLPIACFVGLAALGLTRLLPRTQRQVRVFAWGVAASIVTALVAYFVYRFIALSSLVIDSGGGPWVAVTLFLFAAIAVYLWFEFYRAWKPGVSR
jgi:hypothetical protein